MGFSVDVTQVEKKLIRPLDENFRGQSQSGNEISFTNYYMERNGKPFFGVSGEIHFSRVHQDRWEDELLKMKAGGINVIATYIFWNHHEEIEGEFRFDGRRDLGRFVRLCHKHGLYAIIRVGPFDHGEVRNGGLPDWLYGKGFEVRKIGDGWMYHSERLYRAIAKQVDGMFFKDDGPIIGVQIDNEYMHSSAPWEMTVGTTNEWVFPGDEGEYYMQTMKSLAAQCGLLPVFYTATAWGGAIAPDDMLPLWGGYAFRPWLFYDDVGEHPLTDEYIYQNYHQNDFVSRTDFTPRYQPEDRPYACCEMGGGMMVSYYYRFQYPYKSVDAMANIKLASGCNFLGYYMFHGGSNPKGIHGGFLNEGQVSKISYDYQAALGEFGQVRESYLRLKNLHYFTRFFGEDFIDLPTVLPEGQAELEPSDLKTLRYSLRTDGHRGFLFINNYQDHAVMEEKRNESISLKLKEGTVSFTGLSLASDENCVLPFNLDLNGILLVTASAQPICTSVKDGIYTVFFAAPEGMRASFNFEAGVSINGEDIASYDCASKDDIEHFIVEKDEIKIRIVALERSRSLDLYVIEDEVYLSSAPLLKHEGHVHIESMEHELDLYRYAPQGEDRSELFDKSVVKKELQTYDAKVEQSASSRWTIDLPKEIFSAIDTGLIKDCFLQIDYQGDVGNLFVGGELVHDNFSNGSVWEISIKDFREQFEGQLAVLYISPLKEGSKVQVDSPMAARTEAVDRAIASLNEVRLQPVYGFDEPSL